ncbi:MAG: hypothetical protein Kow0069_30580 [Promethearchaeota archaeon]
MISMSHKFRERLATNLAKYVPGFVLSLLFFLAGLYSFFETDVLEALGAERVAGDVQFFAAAGLVAGALLFHVAWARFVSGFDREQVLDSLAFLIGLVAALVLPVAYFLVSEVPPAFAYSLGNSLALLAAGVGFVAASAALSGKPKWRLGAALLVVGCELAWLGALNLMGGKFA